MRVSDTGSILRRTKSFFALTIAKAIGWKIEGEHVTDPRGHYVGQLGFAFDSWEDLFSEYDFLTDLNVMHQAEKILTYIQRRAYWTQLSMYTEGVGMFSGEATAAQRAEAFLRTIDKWTS
jgi:hypothetical protein